MLLQNLKNTYFFESVLNRHLKKAEQENSFIYHQMVPNECPLLDENASFGLAKLVPFIYPNKSEVIF